MPLRQARKYYDQIYHTNETSDELTNVAAFAGKAWSSQKERK